MREVVTKFLVTIVEFYHEHSRKVVLRPVHSGNSDSHPNRSLWKGAPAASVSLIVTQPSAFGFFEPGEEYEVVIRKVERPTAERKS